MLKALNSALDMAAEVSTLVAVEDVALSAAVTTVATMAAAAVVIAVRGGA